MTPEQFIKLLEAIPELKIRKWKDADVVMLFKICYWCALRIGEAIRLKVDDFDLELAYLYLGKTKTQSNDKRIIPVVFIPELRAWLRDKHGELFPGLNYPIVYNWLIRLGKMLDIKALNTPQSETGEKTKTHIFRKSRGKDMYFGTLTGHKADIMFVSDRLGHHGKNRVNSTMIYLQLGDEGVRNYDEEEAKILSEQSDQV